MSGTGYVIVMAVVVVAVYTISCWWWPFTTCWKCEGAGKFARRDGKVWRDCRRCKGSGKRLRVGRLVWNAARDRRRAASK